MTTIENLARSSFHSSSSPAGPAIFTTCHTKLPSGLLMRFLTTLLPLITLAVHVAATNPEQGSIPLRIVHPEDTHLPGPPPTYSEATGPNAIIPAAHYSSAQDGVEQPPLPGISPRCQQEAIRHALELGSQELGPNHGDISNLRAVMERVTSVGNALKRHPQTAIACSLVTVGGGLAMVAIYLTKCGEKGDWTCNPFTTSKRDGLGSNPQCKHLDIEVCRNPFPTSVKGMRTSGRLTGNEAMTVVTKNCSAEA
ncbi:hypothetical protein EV368DRAFT_66020 [Lentinula lateritia]|nr:hypothetical protein EV368DRAFT_66020 [Lentinula lateritia]